jgi:hypothetical protein
MEDEKREHENKMKKMEAEMEQVFKMKVSEKKQKLKDSESDVSLKTIEIQLLRDSRQSSTGTGLQNLRNSEKKIVSTF